MWSEGSRKLLFLWCFSRPTGCLVFILLASGDCFSSDILRGTKSKFGWTACITQLCNLTGSSAILIQYCFFWLFFFNLLWICMLNKMVIPYLNRGVGGIHSQIPPSSCCMMSLLLIDSIICGLASLARRQNSYVVATPRHTSSFRKAHVLVKLEYF